MSTGLRRGKWVCLGTSVSVQVSLGLRPVGNVGWVGEASMWGFDTENGGGSGEASYPCILCVIVDVDVCVDVWTLHTYYVRLHTFVQTVMHVHIHMCMYIHTAGAVQPFPWVLATPSVILAWASESTPTVWRAGDRYISCRRRGGEDRPSPTSCLWRGRRLGTLRAIHMSCLDAGMSNGEMENLASAEKLATERRIVQRLTT